MDAANWDDSLFCDFCHRRGAAVERLGFEWENLFCCYRYWCRFKLMLVRISFLPVPKQK